MARQANFKRYVLAAVLFSLPLFLCVGMTVFTTAMQAQKMRLMDLGLKVSEVQMLAMDLADLWWSLRWVAIPLLLVVALLLGALPLLLGRNPEQENTLRG